MVYSSVLIWFSSLDLVWFGSNIDILKDGAEACDVIIRCYLLSECLNKVLDDVEVEAVEEGLKNLTK